MLEYAAVTDSGKLRKHNEDALLSLPEQGLFAVADGMGGHEAGEIASQEVITFIKSNTHLPLEKAAAKAELHLRDIAKQGKGSTKMGTTLVAMQFSALSWKLIWAGDSRAYLWQQDKGLRQLSRDHSFVQDMIDQGSLSAEDAEQNPRKYLITNCISTFGSNVNIALKKELLLRHGRFLLCSDGLTNEVTEQQIETVMSATFNRPDAAVERLKNMALEQGGKDNISIIVIDKTPGL